MMSDFRLECTKFDFRWGSALNPAGEAFSAPPDPWICLRGLLLRGGRGREREEVRGRTGMGERRRKFLLHH